MITILLIIAIIMLAVAIAVLIHNTLFLNERVDYESSYNVKLNNKFQDELNRNSNLTDELINLVNHQQAIEKRINKVLEKIESGNSN